MPATIQGSSQTASQNGSEDVTYRSLLGERVRVVRAAKKMSQAELAVAAGFSRKTVVDVEAGRQNPQLDTLLKLMRGLGLDSLEQLTSGLARWGSGELADLLDAEAEGGHPAASSG